ncbi:MAG: D-alanyl-D-alanine carboxypeptidase family protein [Candidatus Rokuibacteriota bacterium]
MHRASLGFALALTLSVPVPAAAIPNGRPPALSAEAVLLLDSEGRTLYEKNADLERPPASLVKLMTLYLAFDDLEANRANLDEPVTVSRRAAIAPKFRMRLRAGEQVPLRVLLEGMAIASANDAATAVAEHLASDEAAFVERMNATARKLGLTATRFANPHGLPDPGQRSSARDIARLAVRLLQDHPAARLLLGGQTFIFRSRVYTRYIPLFQDPLGIQTLKTGFTQEAGYNLTVVAWRDNQRFVMVVLGCRSRTRSFLDARRLLHFGFVETGLETPAEEQPRPARRPVRLRRTSDGG